MEKVQLLEKIEECRHEMILLTQSHELTSETVIATSEKLDNLINDYQNYAH
ncbi:aspartyl-phosphate phosphatase Spo0E family protein [Virgibacillus sp. NKC19-3]|uniref:aspartyl-phosphate phosphatase Spo0E family protein n=1 Tax=Virgibacillus saliphilus TaxID=2831674 RepID=UPI001C9B3613|nr:aspartyl-phosphate phosphatase Spo0E family protein [Virgibacillus sp. NKC19-3]MBY7141844.1 aspartyl-phosphate phosphatase Spo0E family protein [Virgibacillus sp. NKC19-3]